MSRCKYLLILPFVFLILTAIYFQSAVRHINDTLLHEMYIAKIETVNTLAAGIEAIPERLRHEHMAAIKESVEYIDKLHQIYGAAYMNTDGGLTLLTKRSYETSVFEPMEYPEFLEAIRTRDRDAITINYIPERQNNRDLYIYFRWVLNRQYLLIIGVSRHSVVSEIPVIVSSGVWINTVMTFVLNVLLILCFICSPFRR